MVYLAIGSEERHLNKEEIESLVFKTLNAIGKRRKVLAIPPDISRFHSFAGYITEVVYKYFKESLTDILPSIGTHYAMTDHELEVMYPSVPKSLFRVHDWRNGTVTLGEVPEKFINEVSEGKLNYSIPIQLDKLIVEGKFNLILSIGQVVPHEVIGMANYNKNVLIGTGGKEGIYKSHFLGAVYGMERIMGRADNPVRKVLNYGSDNFLKGLPIIYILTVIGKNEKNKLEVKGLFIGDDFECFKLASELSLKVNFTLLDKQLKKVVVYLPPQEYKSTWLGNKSIYRTRMAIADNGELIILAPGLHTFGEADEIDKVIRKYGYVGTDKVLQFVKEYDDIGKSLGAAAHLIHGSSEGRFNITYCPGNLSKEEIESVNFDYADLSEMMKIYDPEKLKDGFNIMGNGEEIFFISNPGLGLWSFKDKFFN
jgi:nickel-dependent lactate racemase